MARLHGIKRHRTRRIVVGLVVLLVILIPMLCLSHIFGHNDDDIALIKKEQAIEPRVTTPLSVVSFSANPLAARQQALRGDDVTPPTLKANLMKFDEANAEMLAHLDGLDPLPPRDGEKPISFMEFVHCLEQRLRVDRRTKRELPINNDKPFIPYVVLPVTFELRDIKQFMCNLTVPFKHLMYVQNGPIYSMSEFLDATEAIFAFTPRLQIRRYPKNLGYAGALNVAMRHALTFPFEEVPYFFMSNNDVRFHESTLLEALPRFLSASMDGAELLKEFMAEVATEPNEYTPEVFRDVPLRSSDAEHVLVTSRYLPDRIRYMSVVNRSKIFRGHAGVLYPDMSQQTAVWGISRLMMETVGFFDENCFPAYYEDTEYLTRTELFGFDVIHAAQSKGGTIHLVNNFLVTEKAHAGAAGVGDVLVFLRGLAEIIRHMLPGQYVGVKPSIVNLNQQGHFGLAGHTLLPPDAYVLNERRRRALDEMIELSLAYYRDAPAGARLQQSPDIIAFVAPKKRMQLIQQLTPYVDGSSYYKNGYALRRLSVPM
jgi:glycosyltransferase involved in cell wall biosynthesis